MKTHGLHYKHDYQLYKEQCRLTCIKWGYVIIYPWASLH